MTIYVLILVVVAAMGVVRIFGAVGWWARTFKASPWKEQDTMTRIATVGEIIWASLVLAAVVAVAMTIYRLGFFQHVS